MTKGQAEQCQRDLRKLGVEVAILPRLVRGFSVVVESKELYWAMPDPHDVANFAMGLRWRDEEAKARG